MYRDHGSSRVGSILDPKVLNGLEDLGAPGGKK